VPTYHNLLPDRFIEDLVDWVTSLFRRVLSLYENLPEEGGKKNTTGGRQEESVVKSIKSMLDLICLHLSDPLFDLVLKLVYDYATTNAKSNAVKAIGQMISSLALAHPVKTINKFLPFCLSQIKDELKHGASSVRTTSSHVAIPSDTTLHWSTLPIVLKPILYSRLMYVDMSILRGCFGHDGTAVYIILVKQNKRP
jgi:proteasome activator subunit 4